MRNKPLIGVLPQYQVKEKKIRIFPEYMEAILDAGGIPCLLPFTDSKINLEQIVDRFEGFLFTGGQDVNPDLYNQEMCHCSNEILPIRDTLEINLLDRIIKENKPVFGICRGIQLINVYFGGTLYQDIFQDHEIKTSLQHEQKTEMDIPVHSVRIYQDSILYKILGKETIRVNSYHHQGIRTLGKNLEIMAQSNDELIEAIRVKSIDFGIAVQWHPELLYKKDLNSQKLFKKFVQAAEKA